MKTKLLITAICILFGIALELSAYNYLTVSDPRSGWWSYNGTIEDAEIHIKPQGIYMDVDLFLTFSARGTGFTNIDSLEVVYLFELPEGAIVHDSWLWFDDDTLIAKIMDKWTASSIYEGVVKRRRDPSILQKQYDNQYELRVFPMAGNETRKVKISFMLPVNWTRESVSVQLLTDILNVSSYPLESIDIITWEDDTWKNPVIHTNPAENVSFTKTTISGLGSCYKATISNSAYSYYNTISFSSPAQNGIYLSTYNNGNEGLYQLAFLPSSVINSVKGQKVAVLFDYDISKTDLTTDNILQQTKELLLSNLSGKDSFNLIFSNINIKKASNNWLCADSLTIANTFNNLSNPLSSYSNLTALISAGIEFVKGNGNDGKIILISNSCQYGDASVANKLINDIMALMDPIIPIYISDYVNSYYEYYYSSGRYYYNNEYFFSTLSKFTKGSYSRVLDNYSFGDVVSLSLQFLGGTIKSFDLYTKLDNGITYGRYYLNSASDIVYLNSAVLQVGKFKGDLPFVINISGEYESEIITDEVTFTEGTIPVSDSILEAIWAGIYIQHLEDQSKTNDLITEIIQNSIKERVLSLYTAFLCIPEVYIPCEGCEEDEDNNFPVSVQEEKNIENKDFLLAYPNPFSNNLTITLNLDENIGETVSKVAIYSITGQEIYVFDLASLQSGNTLSWDGTGFDGESLSKGVYILVVNTDKKVYQLKLVKE